MTEQGVAEIGILENLAWGVNQKAVSLDSFRHTGRDVLLVLVVVVEVHSQPTGMVKEVFDRDVSGVPFVGRKLERRHIVLDGLADI